MVSNRLKSGLSFFPVIFIPLFSLTVRLSAVTPPAKEALARRQELIYNLSNQIQSLNPHYQKTYPEGVVLENLFEGLVRCGPNGSPEPAGAIRWKPNADFTVWTFTLRPEVKWSDGRPVTAHDYVYAWRRFSDPNDNPSLRSSMINEHLKIQNASAIHRKEMLPESLGVQAIDDLTLEVTLEKPVAEEVLLAKLMEAYFFPLRPEYLQQVIKSDSNVDPALAVSNGPFRLASWRTNFEIVLLKNEHYWQAEEVVLEKVTFQEIEVKRQMLTLMESGQCDISLFYGSKEDWVKLKKEYPKNFHTFPCASVLLVHLNNRKPPFNDPRVRKAFNLLLDREWVIEHSIGARTCHEGLYTPLNGMMGGGLLQPEWAKWSMANRTKRAKELLEEVGYNDKNPLWVIWTYWNLNPVLPYLTSMHITAHVPFIRFNLLCLDLSSGVNALEAGDYQMVTSAFTFASYLPRSPLRTYCSHDDLNYTGYQNAEYDQLVEQLDDPTLSTEKKMGIVKEAEKILLKDCPALAICARNSHYLVSDRVGGFKVYNPSGTPFLKDLYRRAGRRRPKSNRERVVEFLKMCAVARDKSKDVPEDS